MKFLCGAAREKVTPEIGTHLYGYTPYIVCDEIHDDLFVSATVLASEEERLLLISVDSGDLNTALFEDLKKACAEKCEINENRIIIAATHTHCAPNLSGFEGWGNIDEKYYNEIFRPAVLRAVENASQSVAEAEIGIATGSSEVGINRREYTQNCETILGQNPWGRYDPTMTVIKIRRRDNRQGIVNLVHYGCHGTACGASTVVTRDWYGIMLDSLEKETGTLSVFFNGAIGDVGPRISNGHTVGDIGYVEELGEKAAKDAAEISAEIKEYYTPEIKSFFGEILLPYKNMPPLEEIQRRKAEIKEPDSLCNCEALEYSHLCEVEDVLLEGVKISKPEGFRFNLPAFAVSDICILPFPYEIFSETAIRLRLLSPFKNTLCLSCANGYNGYLPSQDQLCRGGYEVNVFKFGSVFPLADNTDDNLINETLKIIKEGN